MTDPARKPVSKTHETAKSADQAPYGTEGGSTGSLNSGKAKKRLRRRSEDDEKFPKLTEPVSLAKIYQLLADHKKIREFLADHEKQKQWHRRLFRMVFRPVLVTACSGLIAWFIREFGTDFSLYKDITDFIAIWLVVMWLLVVASLTRN